MLERGVGGEGGFVFRVSRRPSSSKGNLRQSRALVVEVARPQHRGALGVGPPTTRTEGGVWSFQAGMFPAEKPCPFRRLNTTRVAAHSKLNTGEINEEGGSNSSPLVARVEVSGASWERWREEVKLVGGTGRGTKLSLTPR